MEDEKKIITPKEKKAVSTRKKKSNVAETIDAAAPDAQDLTVDAAGEIKPTRKTKTAAPETPVIKKRATRTAKTQIKEAAEIIDADEAKPRNRKMTTRKSAVADAEVPAGKDSVKPARKRTTKKSSAEEMKQVETGEEIKLLPQSESSALPEISAAPQAETVGEPKQIDAETETEKVEETPDPLAGKSPAFRELAAPKLPDLQPENRAWLQMQSPTRIFFYWSLKTNPFETLQKVFGGRGGDYALSVKLQNLTGGTETIYPLAPYGSAWFDVKADSTYRAEVGFYDERRPFIRLVFSNTMETPRLAPSSRTDWTPEFATTAGEFSEVLDASGYRQDAFEMALAGDDLETANKATFDAFEQLTGESQTEVDPAELRLALFALASGLSLEDLRGRISPPLFAYLEKLMREQQAALTMEKILAALQEHFGLGTLEAGEEEDEFSYSVVGVSRINLQRFPKQFWRKLAPLSSEQRISS